MKQLIGLAVLVGASAMSTMAHATNWQTATKESKSNDEFWEYEVDVDSIAVRDGMRLAWIRNSFSPAAELKVSNGEKYSSTVSLEHFNCPHKEKSVSQLVFYSGRFGSGEVLTTLTWKRSEVKDNLEAVVPGSRGAQVLDFVCNFKLKK